MRRTARDLVRTHRPGRRRALLAMPAALLLATVAAPSTPAAGATAPTFTTDAQGRTQIRQTGAD